MKRLISTALAALLGLILPMAALSQNVSQPNQTVVQAGLPIYYLITQTATSAVNNQTTITIPAPSAGLYNYICTATFTASQDGTSTANTNLSVTSTNIKDLSGTTPSWKYSLEATANKSLALQLIQGNPATGCTKSTLPATATTFVSPSAVANTAFSFSVQFYPAP